MASGKHSLGFAKNHGKLLTFKELKMPNERSKSSYFNQSRASPYPHNSKNADKYQSPFSLAPVGDEKEWEETRCPVCMEHPHNAVLLLCSSHEKGCHPYICNTSSRHSNCFDQFYKSSTDAPLVTVHDEEVVPLPSTAFHGGIAEPSSQSTRFHGREKVHLICPLCRGIINEWIVIEPARQFMSAKKRSCSLETCDFSGNYKELRKHAKLEHWWVRPTEVDPSRQRDWAMMELQNDLADFISAIQPGPELISAVQPVPFREFRPFNFIINSMEFLFSGIDATELENETYEDMSSLLDIEPEPSVISLEPLFDFDPLGLGSSAGSDRRRSRRSTASNRTRTDPANRWGSNNTSRSRDHQQTSRGRSRF